MEGNDEFQKVCDNVFYWWNNKDKRESAVTRGRESRVLCSREEQLSSEWISIFINKLSLYLHVS